jgi:hypothetical protein
MAEDYIINVKVQGTTKVKSQLEDVGKSASQTGSVASLAMGPLDQVFGGLPSKLMAARKGVQGLNLGFKGMKSAIAATGIGLFVVAIGEIAANWDSVRGFISKSILGLEDFVGKQKLVLEDSKALLSQQTQSENILRLQGLSERKILEMRMMATDEVILQTEELLKQLQMQLEIAKVMDAMGQLNPFASSQVAEVQEEIKETENNLLSLQNTRAGIQLRLKEIDEQEVQALEDKNTKSKNLREANAKDVEAYLVAARLQRESERTQEEARVASHFEELREKAKGNAEQLAQLRTEERLAYEAIDSKYQQQEQDAIDEANEKRLESETAVTEALNRERMTAREVERADLETHYDKLAEQAGENAELQLEVETERLNARAALQKKFDDEDSAARQAKSDKDLAKAKADLEAEMALRTEFATNTFSILSNLNEAFSKKGEEQSKKSFERTKAISIAETLVSTYLSAQAAFASQFKPLATIDSPIRGALAAGAAVAGGLARVAAIKSQQYSGGGGAGGAGVTGGGFSGGATSVGVDVGSLIPNQQTPTPEPVRAYVVSNEISNRQALDRELQIQTTL